MNEKLNVDENDNYEKIKQLISEKTKTINNLNKGNYPKLLI
jgi:hypothetical protein